jgi:hypothetical protein
MELEYVLNVLDKTLYQKLSYNQQRRGLIVGIGYFHQLFVKRPKPKLVEILQ